MLDYLLKTDTDINNIDNDCNSSPTRQENIFILDQLAITQP